MTTEEAAVVLEIASTLEESRERSLHDVAVILRGLLGEAQRLGTALDDANATIQRLQSAPSDGMPTDRDDLQRMLSDAFERGKAQAHEAHRVAQECGLAPVGGGVPELDHATLWDLFREDYYTVSRDAFDKVMRFTVNQIASRLPALKPGEASGGVEAIAHERRRQIEKEGWTAQHDDEEHRIGHLEAAAICYASARIPWMRMLFEGLKLWPWHADWWKPADHRRNLVKAGALLAAAIDKLDRRTQPTPTERGADHCGNCAQESHCVHAPLRVVCEDHIALSHPVAEKETP